MNREITHVEAFPEEGIGIIIVINYEDGGYDEKTIYFEDISSEFEYVPRGC